LNRITIAALGALAAIAIAPAAMAETRPTPPAAARPAPARTIVKVAGNIYRAGNGNWWSLFVVTPKGIILADPISPEFALWLKGQLAERFPGLAVRYVIYSHSHFDHIEGGGVFADTALFVAQDGVRKNMDGRFPHMPGDMIDRNNDGVFEAEEIDIPSNQHPGICGMPSWWFKDHDRNGDGRMTPQEYFADVHPVDITYSERMTLSFGGETIQLIHPGKNHADDGTVLYFPAERVVFSTDFPADALVGASMRSLPSACGAFDEHPMSEWIRSYRTIEDLDFDILAQGHGSKDFTKADVTEGRQYFEYLRDQVSGAMARGMSLEEMRRTLMLEKYKGWAFYDRLRVMNIEAAYNNLRIYK
jgi:glyoxylase-like metal-dependent hydrolase (beta-lactamase superfamily II)